MTEPAYILLSEWDVTFCKKNLSRQNSMRRIYLDYNATAPVAPEVLEAMLPYLRDEFGNASSVHSFGQRARGAVEHARAAVAALIGAKSNQVFFTSGGTESDNAAIFGILGGCFGGFLSKGSSPKAPGHIITTTIEHHAVLHACQALERAGIRVTYVSVGRDGVVDPYDIRRALRPETALISVMHANNELGTIQPIEEIGRIAAEAGVCFHTDSVQSAGKMGIDVRKLGVHLLSISGHKFGAPKGVGALFVRTGTHLEPILYGGHNDRDRRAGTENVPGIVALGKAAELAAARLLQNGPEQSVTTRVGILRDRLEQGLLERIPGASVNGGPNSTKVTTEVTTKVARTPNTSNMLFPLVDSEALVIALDLAGLACSAGAACSSGAVDPSHVLTAIGLSPAEARASVRLSLGPETIDDDIAAALELIPAAVARQREVSAEWSAARRATVSFSAPPVQRRREIGDSQ